MTKLTLGSLFDGIGVFPLAASRYGIQPLWTSEIEKAPISITKRHFPDIHHLGDITKVKGGEIHLFILLHLAQQEKARRSNLYSGKRKQKRVYQGKYALSGKVICEHCGDIFRRVKWNSRGIKATV